MPPRKREPQKKAAAERQPGPGETRDRILREAMRLFGEQGFAATSVSQIEQAAGLSKGAGGIYRHFRSKEDVLRAGVARQIAQQGGLLDLLASLSRPDGPAQAQVVLAAVARAGLARLDDERDLNRLLLRDLRAHPDVLADVLDGELRAVFAALSAALGAVTDTDDPDALAAVLMGAVTHYWMLVDTFGEHPFGIGQERYLGLLARLAALGGAGPG